jgi:hypothetical protein
MAGVYTVKIAEQDGTLVVNGLANANVYALEDELNGIGAASFGFPKASADAASLDLLDRECQIFRDGALKWCGPMIQAQAEAGSAEVRVDVPGLGWYLTRRQISDARANRLSNASFESGLLGWTAAGVTATADTARAVLGSYALKLVQANAGVDTFEYQQFTLTAGSIGTLVTVGGYIYIQSSGYVGPALESRGLFVSGIESTVVRDYQFIEVDDSTPRDRWVYLETAIWVPPGKTWTLEVRCYAPGGTAWWDGLRAVKMESLSHYAIDMGVIAGNLLDFVQDPTHGWDDLGITTSDATTGVLLDRHYQYADHTDAWQALQEFVGMGLDWSMICTPTTKVFTTYYPKGTDRTATVTLSMRNAGSGTLSDWRLSVDGSATATRVVMLGDGDGPDREEGYAADALDLGGLVLGEVVNAPPNTPLNGLQTIAEKRLAASKGLVRVLEVTGIPGDTVQHDTLVVGDTVTVSISDGWVDLAGGWRIVRKTVDCESDICSFVLNETSTSIIYDAGSAAAVGSNTIDGGSASTSFVSVIDGGSA